MEKIGFHEAKICSVANGMSVWLDGMQGQARAEVISTARKMAATEMLSARKRAKQIREERKADLKRKQSEMSEREDKRVVSENLLHGITEIGGLWCLKHKWTKN